MKKRNLKRLKENIFSISKLESIYFPKFFSFSILYKIKQIIFILMIIFLYNNNYKLM